ncbi:MAG: Glu-tRNA(Gln) amidotransferase subunit GatE [bacterium]|nr:Glu-tRNA(Gln) amidotransferase subunit GatE [bacterium]
MEIYFGLEVHQQLETRKLHCCCPSVISDKVDHKIRRELHVREGELREKDIAAMYEELKKRYYEYEISPEYCCLVELDEEPPRPPNPEALKIALEVARIFDAEIVDRIYVMRKTIIDGSNVSGFQRTMLVAYDGRIIVDGQEVRIATICLEEDAARKITVLEDKTVYRLDRLGIPLVEISTEMIKGTPKFARKVAEEIGLALRMLGKVKRGLGTIRQDVNVSIPGGNRVELKGVPKLELIEKALELEAVRQQRLLDLREELKKRGVSAEDFAEPRIQDVTELLQATESRLVQAALSRGEKALALAVPGFAGLFVHEILPGKRFGKELAEMLTQLTGFKGLLHSDEICKYGISEKEILELKKLLELGERDGFIIILGKPERVRAALELLWSRIKQCLEGVPREVRKVLEDGSSAFLRPLPGAARMYPETDIPPIDPGQYIKDLEQVPPIWQLREKYRQLGLPEEIITELLREASWRLLEKLLQEGAAPLDAAKILAYEIPRVEEKLGKKLPTEKKLELARFLLLHQPSLKFLLEIINYAEKNACSLEEALKRLHPPKEEILQVIESLGIMDEREIIKALMKKYSGRVDARLVKELLVSRCK